MGGKFSACFGKRSNRVAPDTVIHLSRDSPIDNASVTKFYPEKLIVTPASPDCEQVQTKFPVACNEEGDEDDIDVKKVSRSHLDLLALFEVAEILHPETKQRKRKKEARKHLL
ncbi:hypothetical protein SNE40_019102 [Patella caerulea]|uniref:Uncharacterized protein n=1 Tax=Patella caerulea TaxID=87958 RepID=A0AAN8J6G9_PATCE